MKAAPQTSRLFFAVWPPRASAEALHAWALETQHATGGRVTRAETIHLTLVFLGEVSDNELSGAIQAAREAKSDSHVMILEQAKFWRHNRIVWVGPRETPEPLGLLVESLKAQLMAKNFKTENRPFAAHITLIRKAREPRQLPQLPAVNWPVEEFVLVRSQLSADGSRYERLESFALS